MKHHANRDLREVYWQPDPELDRLKKIRGESESIKTAYVPMLSGSYVQLEVYIEEMERELREKELREAKWLSFGNPVSLKDIAMAFAFTLIAIALVI